MYRFISAVVALVVILGNNVTFAQAPASSSEATVEQASTGGTTYYGPISCNLYYKHDIVKTSITANTESTVPGAPVSFSGTVKNEGKHAIVGAAFLAKVYITGDGTPEVIDQFMIGDRLTLGVGAEKNIEQEWQVPLDAENGEYIVSYYVVGADGSELLGRPNSDLMASQVARFSVTEGAAAVRIVKNKTLVNGVAYDFSSPIQLDNTTPMTVEVTVENPANEAKRFPVQWRQSAWDGTKESHSRGGGSEVVTLEAGEVRTFSYTAQVQAEPVTLVSASVREGGINSSIAIQAVWDSASSSSRFVFAGVMGEPLKKGEGKTLVGCVETAGKDIPEGIVTIAVTDRDGAVVREYRYEGTLFAAQSGFGESFNLERDYDFLRFTAKLEQNGAVADEVTMEYDCQLIDPASCPVEEGSLNAPLSKLPKMWLLIGGVVVLLVVIGVAATAFGRRRRNQPESSNIVEGVEMKLPDYTNN